MFSVWISGGGEALFFQLNKQHLFKVSSLSRGGYWAFLGVEALSFVQLVIRWGWGDALFSS